MAKLSKDEFKQKYSEIITDNDDLLIPLLEDIEDSVDVADTRVILAFAWSSEIDSEPQLHIVERTLLSVRVTLSCKEPA